VIAALISDVSQDLIGPVVVKILCGQKSVFG
jgi:hypothetical protein